MCKSRNLAKIFVKRRKAVALFPLLGGEGRVRADFISEAHISSYVGCGTSLQHFQQPRPSVHSNIHLFNRTSRLCPLCRIHRCKLLRSLRMVRQRPYRAFEKTLASRIIHSESIQPFRSRVWLGTAPLRERGASRRQRLLLRQTASPLQRFCRIFPRQLLRHDPIGVLRGLVTAYIQEKISHALRIRCGPLPRDLIEHSPD